MAEGSESMERGQHVSFEYERHLDTPVYHFGVTIPRNWKAENDGSFMICGSLRNWKLQWHASDVPTRE